MRGGVEGGESIYGEVGGVVGGNNDVEKGHVEKGKGPEHNMRPC